MSIIGGSLTEPNMYMFKIFHVHLILIPSSVQCNENANLKTGYKELYLYLALIKQIFTGLNIQDKSR